ncbi:MAG: ribulose-phosphate 3-epimerase [Emergencia sp.]|jgi:ribulose-phosphate 3-epimerase|uniref:Ribulose-phosphate 3-epimerase n=1 Tax=Anaerotruncus colihominis TaxID=169435 RepID=A0A845QN13_9FIRM|nr:MULTISPECIES: ribulose-phosphate 3-epimerase [Eubacteriales]MCI9475671.1 ribulose-phosphate 3-epimerase [Emergencia sp.]NBH62113.1 ribulose-phosphate 3-epimerase [Anaerotruncus colihominis]NCF02768.1 ribulose-phosphate 3-epimerase [Anaerotruncus sp. 80]
MGKLAPSILSADFAELGKQVEEISRAGADYVHIDVMDGHFVPNISFGAAVMKALNKLDTAPYDVHLMIENPDQYVSDFVTDRTEYIVVHQEACPHLHRSLQNIKAYGVKAGVAINPATPISTLECVLEDVDLILVMSVNPGFGGQKFIPVALDKIRQLDTLRREAGYHYTIEVDGGITLDNVEMVKAAGCDIFVAGSAVFGAENLTERVKEFKEVL